MVWDHENAIRSSSCEGKGSDNHFDKDETLSIKLDATEAPLAVAQWMKFRAKQLLRKKYYYISTIIPNLTDFETRNYTSLPLGRNLVYDIIMIKKDQQQIVKP